MAVKSTTIRGHDEEERAFTNAAESSRSQTRLWHPFGGSGRRPAVPMPFVWPRDMMTTRRPEAASSLAVGAPIRPVPPMISTDSASATSRGPASAPIPTRRIRRRRHGRATTRLASSSRAHVVAGLRFSSNIGWLQHQTHLTEVLHALCKRVASTSIALNVAFFITRKPR